MLAYRSIATRTSRAKLLLACAVAYGSPAIAHPQQYSQLSDLSNLGLEALMNIDVVSVSKQSEPLQRSAAAIYVLQSDTIALSGVESIPEALRMIPGLQVARINSNNWAIGARGFNSVVSDKLEVLMDGRSLYTPLFSGVFWNSQDYLIHDIERIEVIRGPGAALWGANAVNGVVNIVSKHAADTQGGLGIVGGGGEFEGFSAWRYGGTLSDLGHYRIYAKTTHYNPQAGLIKAFPDDDWKQDRLGFRSDLTLSGIDNLTLQGDSYRGSINSDTERDDENFSGSNVLARWNRRHSEASDTELQFYYDYSKRSNQLNFAERRQTTDIDVKHRFAWGKYQSLIIGGGYRLSVDTIDSFNPTNTLFMPDNREDETYGLFIQDQFAVIPDVLQITAGVKYERNDYSGNEFQPSLRFSYAANTRNTLWGAVSRAVRIPNRLDHDASFSEGFLTGNGGFESEELIAYELGYRSILSDTLSADLALFYNKYDNLRGLNQDLADPSTIPPVLISNEGEGESSGIELTLRWAPAQSLNILASYRYLDLNIYAKAQSRDTVIESANENDPRHQMSLTSTWKISNDWSLYSALRWVDKLPDQAVDEYLEIDVSLHWKLSEALEFSIIGKNLSDSAHPEFGNTSEINRSIHGRAIWHF